VLTKFTNSVEAFRVPDESEHQSARGNEKAALRGAAFH